MAVDTLTVASTGDDYDTYYGDGSSSPYAIYAIENNALSITSQLWFKPDISALPSSISVSGLRLRLYEYSYTASRGISKIYTVQILDGGVVKTDLKGNTYAGLGLNTWITLPSSFYSWVGNGHDTHIRIVVPDPGGSYARTFGVQDSSYGSGREMQLEVTYTERPSGQVHVVMIGA